jgi:NAD(P)-dependent dehydrogenase (short-subunit alcohol dehydrogenase family)
MYVSQTLDNVTPERMLYSFQLNSMAPLFVTKALLPNLRKASSHSNSHSPDYTNSKVVIVSSLMGSIADNDSGGHYGYRAAKAAVNMVGKSLAANLAKDKFAVGMVHPGMVFTSFGAGERRPGHRNVDESVKGVLEAMDQVTMDNSGCFLHGNYGEGVKPLSW